jgi:hypothetical protein
MKIRVTGSGFLVFAGSWEGAAPGEIAAVVQCENNDCILADVHYL